MKITAMFWGLYSIPLVFSISQQSKDKQDLLQTDQLKDTEVHTANIHPQQQPLMPLALNDDAGSRSLRFPEFAGSRKDYVPQQSPKKSEKITYKFKGTMELERSSKSVADSYYEKRFPKFDDSKKRFPEFDDNKKRFPKFPDNKKGFSSIWKDYVPQQSPKGFPSKLKNREINYVPFKSPKNLYSPQPARVYIPEEQDEELNDEIDRTDDFLNDYENNDDNGFF